MTNQERQEKIKELKKSGKSFSQIASLFKVSRQRIQQIIVKDYSKNLPFLDKCQACGEGFTNSSFRNRKFCDKCSGRLNNIGGRERTRELVRMRDKYTCQNCGKVWNEHFRRFDVHHLNGKCGKLSKKYDACGDLSGMITLCHKCHFNHPEHTIKSKWPLKMRGQTTTSQLVELGMSIKLKSIGSKQK